MSNEEFNSNLRKEEEKLKTTPLDKESFELLTNQKVEKSNIIFDSTPYNPSDLIQLDEGCQIY